MRLILKQCGRYQRPGIDSENSTFSIKEFMEDILVMDYPQLCKNGIKPTLRDYYIRRESE